MFILTLKEKLLIDISNYVFYAMLTLPANFRVRLIDDLRS